MDNITKSNVQSLETPYGTYDLLPHDTAIFRFLEAKISSLLNRFGYDEVITPTIEYLQTLVADENRTLESHLFKLFDKTNRTLALRHEMTTPIARLVSKRLKSNPLPIKLSYRANVFRLEKSITGRQCEFHQTGAELIGSDSVAADAEIIVLAVEALRSAGLKDFQLCLGHTGFSQGLMQEFNLSEDIQAKLKGALESHDLVAFEKLVDDLNLKSDSSNHLKTIAYLQGDTKILSQARGMTRNERSLLAIDNLNEIYQLLKTYEVDSFVTFDLGLIRDFNYYTGMVFEIYAPTLGYPLAGGGRYDNLLKNFGLEYPAVGFALGIERLIYSLKTQRLDGAFSKRDFYISYSSGKIHDAINKANELRSDGYVVEMALSPQTHEEALQSQLNKHYDKLIYV